VRFKNAGALSFKTPFEQKRKGVQPLNLIPSIKNSLEDQKKKKRKEGGVMAIGSPPTRPIFILQF
jgi:hypothetical protein